MCECQCECASTYVGRSVCVCVNLCRFVRKDGGAIYLVARALEIIKFCFFSIATGEKGVKVPVTQSKS